MSVLVLSFLDQQLLHHLQPSKGSCHMQGTLSSPGSRNPRRLMEVDVHPFLVDLNERPWYLVVDFRMKPIDLGCLLVRHQWSKMCRESWQKHDRSEARTTGWPQCATVAMNLWWLCFRLHKGQTSATNTHWNQTWAKNFPVFQGFVIRSMLV